jgi:hypothetical protein
MTASWQRSAGQQSWAKESTAHVDCHRHVMWQLGTAGKARKRTRSIGDQCIM